MIQKTGIILKELERAIFKKTPFGLIRFGDGGLKYINAFLVNNKKKLIDITNQEGIPYNNNEQILKLWSQSANICNYIDSPEVYFTQDFWKRSKGISRKKISRETEILLKNWRQLYQKIGINNSNFCNPEINFLSCLNNQFEKNLPEILINKKICCISSRSDINKILPGYNIKVIKISGKNEYQFVRNFDNVISHISNNAKKYDIWLVSAGEVGRIYTGTIKFFGGISFDIGSLIDYWCTGEVPSRLLPYMKGSMINKMNLLLTSRGRKYKEYI